MARSRRLSSARLGRITYERAGRQYYHDFGPSARLETTENGEVLITDARGGRAWEEIGGEEWLTNPPRAGKRKGGQKMARRLPPRYKTGPKKGQFRPRGSGSSSRRKKTTTRRRRNAPARKSAPRRRNAPAARRRRAPRRNPPRRKLMDRTIQAGMDAVTLTAGQGVTRLVPGMLRLPTSGPTGLAISAATALGVGLLGEQVLGRDASRLLTAGAISVPIQQAAMQYIAPAVPMVGAALTPTLGRYPARAPARVGRYPSRPTMPALPTPTSNGRGGGSSGSGRVGYYPYGQGYTVTG